MTVKELLKVQKYYTPVRIVGGDTMDDFFSERFKHMEREKVIEKHGDREVTYFYHEPNYKKNGRMAKLFKYVLVIETKHGSLIIKNCSTCKNNVEFPSPHTCDICTSLNQEEEYSMWEGKE